VSNPNDIDNGPVTPEFTCSFPWMYKDSSVFHCRKVQVRHKATAIKVQTHFLDSFISVPTVALLSKCLFSSLNFLSIAAVLVLIFHFQGLFMSEHPSANFHYAFFLVLISLLLGKVFSYFLFHCYFR